MSPFDIMRVNIPDEIDVTSNFIEKIFEKSTTTKKEYIKAIVAILLQKDEDWIDNFYRKLIKQNKIEEVN